MVLQKNRS